LVWAGALALVFTPLQRRIEARLRRPNLAAALSLVIVGLLVVGPATWFAQKLAEKATSVPEEIQKQIATGKWHIDSDEHPLLGRLLGLVERQVSAPESAPNSTKWVNVIISNFIKESAAAAVQACLTLYFLFHFLRDRDRMLKSIRSVLPLSESDTDTLFSRVHDTIHATVYGMFALSALQGVLGGLMYWWLGVPTPVFWAFVVAAFAFVPVIDTFVIWLPAAVYLGLEGRWGEALGVAAVVSLIVRAIENLLYPVVVKDRLKVPAICIFVALIGGVLLFGWSGLVLGPVIVTVTSVLFEICAKRLAAPGFGLGSPDLPTPAPVKSTDEEETWVVGETQASLASGK
jgi:predicted PurR-regulated permease PerM